ncbi:MAG: IS200/IS605 family transposase [Lachnospiraceae bacterium]|nr:IS200/IS605 family transposase [Lachnospiraceae bacterium]
MFQNANICSLEVLTLDNYNRGSHSVYKLTYHIIFVTKYRKKVITDEIGDFLKDTTEYLCNRMDCELISAETDEDHMHLLVSMPPDIAPVKLINMVKTQLSKEVRTVYAEHVKKYLWGDSFWSASYFCATTGSVSMDTVRSYIESQRTDEHKRKYIRSGRYSKAIHPATDFRRKGFSR